MEKCNEVDVDYIPWNKHSRHGIAGIAFVISGLEDTIRMNII